MDFSDFIRSRGAEKIAEIAAVPINTVHQWVSRRRIPRERWPELLTAYPEVGLPAFQGMERLARTRQGA